MWTHLTCPVSTCTQRYAFICDKVARYMTRFTSFHEQLCTSQQCCGWWLSILTEPRQMMSARSHAVSLEDLGGYHLQGCWHCTISVNVKGHGAAWQYSQTMRLCENDDNDNDDRWQVADAECRQPASAGSVSLHDSTSQPMGVTSHQCFAMELMMLCLTADSCSCRTTPVWLGLSRCNWDLKTFGQPVALTATLGRRDGKAEAAKIVNIL